MPEELEAGSEETAETLKEKAKDEKPTLESMNAKLDNVIAENERLKKQNSDKDSHISKTESENAKLRATLQNASASIAGKAEENKDAEFEQAVKDLVADGYDEGKVRNLLKVQVRLAQKEAQKGVIPLIMEAAEDLIESDPEIDKKFLKDNSEAINSEYNSYKPETSPRKIKANLKKACNIIKERLAEEAKRKETPDEKKKREDMVKGAGSAPKGTKKEEDPDADKFLDGIQDAGGKQGHFV